MVGGWTTDFVRFADGNFRVCTDPHVLAQRCFFGGSGHDFSGPMTVDAAFVVARTILFQSSRVTSVTIRNFDGQDFVLFSC
jgi:hypothetical protein